MSNSLRLKTALLVIVLFLFGTVGIYPLVASRVGITRPAWLIEQQLQLGLDLKGGVQLVLGVQIPEGAPASERVTIVKEVLETIERCGKELGVTEPIIAPQGANGDQILVQLPGVVNV